MTNNNHYQPSATYTSVGASMGFLIVAVGLFVMVMLRYTNTLQLTPPDLPLSTLIAIPFTISQYISWAIIGVLFILMLGNIRFKKWITTATLSLIMTTIFLIGTPEMAWRWAIASGTGAVGCFVYETQDCQSRVLQQPLSISSQYPNNPENTDERSLQLAQKLDKIKASVAPVALKIGKLPLVGNVLGVFISDNQFKIRLDKKIRRHKAILQGATPVHEDVHSILIINQTP